MSAVDLRGLSLRAGGVGRTLFAPLDATVRSGERWVVIGPNGSGKSSLLAAIAGVFPIASGGIDIDGRQPREWSPAALAARRAWCPPFWSDPFPATVAETAALARDRGSGWRLALSPARDPAIAAMLERLDLGSLAHADASTLSGGERQRLAIATTLLQGAPILLLDEPASHLDPSHKRLLVELLAERAACGDTVVASVHDLDLAWDLASHVIVLDGRGGAVAGTRDGLLTAERLGTVFAVRFDEIEHDGVRRFVTTSRVRDLRVPADERTGGR